MRVLLVEDDQSVMQITSLILAQFAHVDTAVDSQSALKLYEHSGPYDLVIIDYGLPDGNGKALLEKIVERVHDQKAVFYTGYLINALGMKASDFTRLNVVDIWSKPLDLSELKQRLEKTANHGAFAYCKNAAA